MPGPIGKRDEDRLRRNKSDLATLKFDLEDEVQIPTAYFLNKVVNDLWLSIKKSVNVKYFEPSDWQYAILALTLWDRELGHDGDGNTVKTPGPTMVMAMDAMLAKLLITEGDRRRLKIESERNGGGKKEDGKLINAQRVFRERFEQQREA